MVEKLVPGPFMKKSKLSISLEQQSDMLQSLFLLYTQVELYQNILKLTCWPLVFPLYKAFLGNKKVFGTSLPASFSAWFLRKQILTFKILLVNSANTNCHPLQVKINCSKFIIDELQPRCHMTLLACLFLKHRET